MLIKLITDSDELAIKHITGLMEPRSLIALLAALANKLKQADEDFECLIQKARIKSSYRENPSLLAQKIREKTTYPDSAGYSTRNNQGQRKDFVIVRLFSEARDSTQRRYVPSNSIMQRLKVFLYESDLNASLKVPIDELPAFYRTHPEQLTYQLKRNTGIKIHISKRKFYWRITRA